MKRTLRHASGWALLAVWFVLGAGCTSQERAAARTVVDVVKALCSPLMTVDECINVILAEPKPLDAGTE